MSSLSDSAPDEDVMAAFSDEVTTAPVADDLEDVHWEPLFIGWCLANGLSVDRARDIHATFRYTHQYQYP